MSEQRPVPPRQPEIPKTGMETKAPLPQPERQLGPREQRIRSILDEGARVRRLPRAILNEIARVRSERQAKPQQEDPTSIQGSDKPKAKTYTRRQVVAAAAGAAALAASGLGVVVGRNTRPEGSVPEIRRSFYEWAPKELVNEIERLGIKENGLEQILWQKGYKIDTRYLTFPTAESRRRGLEAEMTNKAWFVIGKMQQSEIPRFRRAGQNLANHAIKIGDLDIETHLTLENEGFPFASAGWQIGPDGKLVHHIHLSAESLSATPTQEAALTLAHENEHFENQLKLLENLPKDMSSEEKVKALNEAYNTREEHIPEEAQAYAAEMDAFIHGVGMGVYYPGLQYRGLPLADIAVEYILANKDYTNQRWLDFTSNVLIRKESDWFTP